MTIRRSSVGRLLVALMWGLGLDGASRHHPHPRPAGQTMGLTPGAGQPWSAALMEDDYAGCIETQRLRLRPFRPEDLDDLAALNADPRVMRDFSEPLSRQEVRESLAWFAAEWNRLGFGWFAVFDRATDAFVGQCGLQCLEGSPQASDVELAFAFHRRFWGRGYGMEAARAVLAFGFDIAGLQEVVAVAQEQNQASRCLLERLGFEVAGGAELYGWPVLVYGLESHRLMRPGRPDPETPTTEVCS
jgi:RimJ/RimL family protein N-acetyltransferase